MDVTYKVTWKTQMFIVKELWASAVVFVLGYFIMIQMYPGGANTFAKFFVGGFFIIQIIPSALIHFQYLKYNKDTILKVDIANRIVIIKERDATYSFPFDQISTIRLALMADLYNGGKRGLVASVLYHYAFVETLGGEKFIITCLLVNDLRKFFNGMGLEAKWERVFFPMVRMSRYKEKLPKPRKEKSADGW